jgi:hypothetical protein
MEQLLNGNDRGIPNYSGKMSFPISKKDCNKKKHCESILLYNVSQVYSLRPPFLLKPVVMEK